MIRQWDDRDEQRRHSSGVRELAPPAAPKEEQYVTPEEVGAWVEAFAGEASKGRWVPCPHCGCGAVRRGKP